MAEPYWQSQVQPLNRGMNNLSGALMMLPRFRAMQQYRQQMEQIAQAREQAMAQESGARTGLYNAQTDKTQTETSNLKDIAAAKQTLADATPNLLRNPNDNDSISKVFGALSTISKDPNEYAAMMQKMTPLVQAMGGSTNYNQMAAEGGQSGLIAKTIMDNAAIRNNQAIVPQGSTLTDRNTGSPLFAAPANIPQGDVRVGQTNMPPQGVIASGLPPAAKSSAADTAKAQMVKDMIQQQGNTGSGTTNTISSALQQFQGAMQPPAANPAITPGGKVATPMSKDDFDTLPSGSLYVNPADGKTYRKN